MSLGMPGPVSEKVTTSAPSSLSRVTLMTNLPPFWPIASAALRARLWTTRSILPSSKRAVPRSCTSTTSSTPRRREVALELVAHVLEELLQVDLADQDALLAARELEHLALHRADEIELPQDELRVAARARPRRSTPCISCT